MGKRILVVEDDPAVARVLTMALMRQGYQPHLAKDYPTVKTALAEDWDAIVLDINLPGGSGLDLLRTCEKSFTRPPPSWFFRV